MKIKGTFYAGFPKKNKIEPLWMKPSPNKLVGVDLELSEEDLKNLRLDTTRNPKDPTEIV